MEAADQMAESQTYRNKQFEKAIRRVHETRAVSSMTKGLFRMKAAGILEFDSANLSPI